MVGDDFNQRANQVTQVWKDSEEQLRKACCLVAAEHGELEWAGCRIRFEGVPVLECPFVERLRLLKDLPNLLSKARKEMDRALTEVGF